MPETPPRPPRSAVPPTPKKKLSVTVEHEADYVGGFPLMVVVWVTPSPGAGHIAVCLEGPSSRHYGTTVHVTDAATGEVKVDSARATSMVGIDWSFLEADTKWAFLLDLSSDFSKDGAPPGRYSARLNYEGIDTEPFEFVVRAATPVESARLQSLKAEIAIWTPFVDWWDWSIKPIRSEWSVHPPTSHTDPLRYFMLLRYLYQGPIEPDRVPASLFDMLDGMYAPFAAALRADLAFAKGRSDAASNELASARAAHPEIGWELDLLDRTSMSGVQMWRDATKGMRANTTIWAEQAANPPTEPPPGVTHVSR